MYVTPAMAKGSKRYGVDDGLSMVVAPAIVIFSMPVRRMNMGQLRTRTREALRAELEANRTAFSTLLASLSDADLLRASANPAWTVRDLLHHIVASLEQVPGQLQAARRGKARRRVPQWLYDRANVWITRLGAARQTRAGLLARYAAAHQAAIGALDQVEEHEWGRRASFWYFETTIAELFRRQSEHLAEHAAQILRAGDPR
jgi:hypothetical protein